MSNPLPSRAALAQRFVPLTLVNLDREYPVAPMAHWREPGDVRAHRSNHPAFYGCYDWHSAVHSHAQLVRAARWLGEHPLSVALEAALAEHLSAETIAGEMDYLARHPGFEVPYGMAWVLRLAEDLRAASLACAPAATAALAPLEAHAAAALRRHFDKLPVPIRTGLHNQTAFSLGLALDWANRHDAEWAPVLRGHARRFYVDDRDIPFDFEPSASDFLSPGLAEADVLRRLLLASDFERWANGFFTRNLEGVLVPARVVSYSDRQLAHFCGLNLSRAWMLRDLAHALPEGHALREAFLRGAAAHLTAGWQDALHSDIMVSHWAPTYLVIAIEGWDMSNG
ncbi:MAG: DUF2891 domain-containing protein [Thermoflexales bacterium]|nr:DUF2891 domain-containing protein [Thermoflexales bacterium]